MDISFPTALVLDVEYQSLGISYYKWRKMNPTLGLEEDT